MKAGAIAGITIGTILVAALLVGIYVWAYYTYFLNPKTKKERQIICSGNADCPLYNVCAPGLNVCTAICDLKTPCSAGTSCFQGRCITIGSLFAIDTSGKVYTKPASQELSVPLPLNGSTESNFEPKTIGFTTGRLSAADNWLPLIISVPVLDILPTMSLLGQSKNKSKDSKTMVGIIINKADNLMYEYYSDSTLKALPNTSKMTSIMFHPANGFIYGTRLSPNATAGSTPTTQFVTYSKGIQAFLKSKESDFEVNPGFVEGTTAPTGLYGITYGRTPTGTAPVTLSFYGIANVLTGKPNDPSPGNVLYQSTNTMDWTVSTDQTVFQANQNSSDAKAVPVPINYFAMRSIAYNPSTDLYYIVADTPTSSICETATSIGISSSTGGNLKCIQNDTQLTALSSVRVSTL